MNAESILNGTTKLLQAYEQWRVKQAHLQQAVKVSIIVPVYNAMPYFMQCLRSLTVQTLEGMEFIVIDDGGNDGSGTFADALAEVNNTIKVLHQKNAGVSAARNAGLAIARGEYIGFVDADDFVDPELFETLYAAAVVFSADIVHSGYTNYNTNEDVSLTPAPSFEIGKVMGNEDIKHSAAQMHKTGCFLYVWRNLFSRRLIEENNIRFDEEISIGEDTLFNMQCFLKAKTSIAIGFAGYHYRINPESVMQSRYKPLLNSSLQKQFSSKLDLCKKNFPEFYDEFCRDMAKYNITALFPLMLANLYQNELPQKKKQLKELATSALMQKAFADFNLAQIRSRSLDWWMFLFAKHKLYLVSHILCKFVLYKK